MKTIFKINKGIYDEHRSYGVTYSNYTYGKYFVLEIGKTFFEFIWAEKE
jgi:hypothetical protein